MDFAVKWTIVAFVAVVYTVIIALASIYGTYGYMTRGEAKAVKNHYDTQNEKVAEVQEKIVYRDKIVTKRVEVIRHVVDETGCSDANVPDATHDGMYQIYKITARP